jgi:hypothetical protein
VKSETKLLGNNQKELYVAICNELKEQNDMNPHFISTIITGIESWIYGYDLETKQHHLSGRPQIHGDPKKHEKFRTSD